MIQTQNYIRLGLTTLAVNILLVVVKIFTGVVGNSYALVADGIESASDIVSSLIVWTGFQWSLKPPDENHPFGHGKVEALAGFLSGLSLLVSAGLLIYHAIWEILVPQHAPAWYTLLVLVCVILVKEILARKVAAAAAGAESVALKGDAWHHRADALTSAAAAIGIGIALIGGKGWESADDWAALLACSLIIYNGLRIASSSLHEIMDGTVEESHFERARTAAMSVPGVRSTEKLRIRKSGAAYYLELHVRVPANMTVLEGHRVSHDVKDALMALSPMFRDVLIHIEPDGDAPNR